LFDVGEPVPHRPSEDIAFAVTRWFQRGGTLQTYYMWFGGTTFGRWVGGPFIITSYDYDVALDEFGFPHREKYNHLAMLHRTLDSYKDALLQNSVRRLVLNDVKEQSTPFCRFCAYCVQ
jgi:hypothetical protein